MTVSQAENPLVRQASLVSPVIADDWNDTEDRVWWTVYCRPHQEKQLALQLSEWGIPFFLPQAPRECCIRGRSLTSHLPLFNNFMFLFCSEDECLATLSTRLISRILPVTDDEQLRQNLRHVQQLVENGSSLTVESRIASGVKVRILDGPLTGIEGTLIERSGGRRLVVTVDEIGQGVSISVDHLSLESVQFTV